MRSFRLYPEERHFWSFSDYGAVLDVMKRLCPRTVLEFGPGSSTLALIEGGAETVDCCESDPHWFSVYRTRLECLYDSVTLYAYDWAAPLSIPALDRRAYDLALIDGPLETELRPACIAYALERCTAVLVPLEEKPEQAGQGYLRQVVAVLALERGRDLEITETGPLAGAFALMTSP